MQYSHREKANGANTIPKQFKAYGAVAPLEKKATEEKSPRSMLSLKEKGQVAVAVLALSEKAHGAFAVLSFREKGQGAIAVLALKEKAHVARKSPRSKKGQKKLTGKNPMEQWQLLPLEKKPTEQKSPGSSDTHGAVAPTEQKSPRSQKDYGAVAVLTLRVKAIGTVLILREQETKLFNTE
ncbi:hypothetical protein DPMN_117050 [Dreissena polymorpha]|uniref:Uncharacterized protein n=1 Tax=Dreissena polymorpha TaxID=45954 RepID=A0A9D4KP51_DREPO|nr:hypothetical protein DPMN_117050 [Dreissena polymorpha]